MADAVWPNTLPPEPRLSEYTESPPDLVMRSQMSSGPAKARKRNSANVRVANFTFDLTQAQWVTFDQFFVGVIAGGALPFELIRPSTGNVADWRIVGLPEYVPLSPRAIGRYIVRFQAEMLPGTERINGDPPDPEEPGENPERMYTPPGDHGGHSLQLLVSLDPSEPDYFPVLVGIPPDPQEDYIMLVGFELGAASPYGTTEPFDALSQVAIPGDPDQGTDYGGDIGHGGSAGGTPGGVVGW